MNAGGRQAITVGAMVVAVTLGGIAFWAARERAALERRLVVARTEGARLRAEWRTLREQGRKAEKRAVVTSAPVAAPAATQPAKALPARERPRSLSDIARNNPQLWNEFVRSKRAEMGRFFLPVMQRLNLTPAQRERCKDILTEHLARNSDIAAAANEQGLAFEDPVLVKLRAENAERRKSELRELLGEAGLQEFENFERATPMRGLVDGFAVQVARFAPLSSQQADQFERALAQANAAFREGKHAEAAALDWAAADEKAREILTPQQFEAWKLGVAHNSFGGMRIEREMEALYRRAVERAKEAVKAQGN